MMISSSQMQKEPFHCRFTSSIKLTRVWSFIAFIMVQVHVQMIRENRIILLEAIRMMLKRRDEGIQFHSFILFMISVTRVAFERMLLFHLFCYYFMVYGVQGSILYFSTRLTMDPCLFLYKLIFSTGESNSWKIRWFWFDSPEISLVTKTTQRKKEAIFSFFV